MKFPENLEHFVSNEIWTRAKSPPDWAHEYLVRDRVDGGLFEQAVRHVRTNGRTGRFYSREFTYFEVAGLVYWTMGAPVDETTILNRCRKEDTFEYRERAGTLPEPRR